MQINACIYIYAIICMYTYIYVHTHTLNACIHIMCIYTYKNPVLSGYCQYIDMVG